MTLLRVIVEGQTEERIVKDVLAPHLGAHGVFATPTLVNKSPSSTSRIGKGGGRSYRPWQRDVVNTLKQNAEWHVTTLIDLYALPNDFPTPASMPPSGPAIADAIEQAFDADIQAQLSGAHPWRFIPYVQRHELEALLFVDPAATAAVIAPGSPAYEKQIAAVAAAYGTPEDINDGPQTAPSKRLGGAYKKTRHGPKIVARVGLPALRAACPRFDMWLSRLEAL